MKYIVFKKVRIAADGNTCTTHLLKILKKEQRGLPRLFTRFDMILSSEHCYYSSVTLAKSL